MKVLLVAIEQAKQAYGFCPNSYTYSAMVAVFRVARELEMADWIAAFSEYAEGPVDA